MQEQQQQSQPQSGNHPTEQQEVIRALGSTEHLFWLCDQNRPTHFAVVAEIEGNVTLEAWREAFVALQQRHPLLSARIATDAGMNPCFYRVSGVRIPLRVVERAGTSWQAEVAAELATPIDPLTAPLVRATLLTGDEGLTLILVAHHSVVDGMASSFLISDLLRALSGEHLPALQLAHPLEVLLSDEVRAAPVSPPPALAPTPKAYREEESKRVQVEGIALSSALTLQLIARSHKEQTTVHGAVCAAVHEAGRRLSPEWCRRPVRTITPIDVRHCSDDIGTDAGVYITQTVTVDDHQRGTPFWDMARTMKRNVASAQTRDATLLNLKDLQAAMTAHTTVQHAAGFASVVLAFDVLLSNLGNDPVPSAYGRLKLNALWGPMLMTGFVDDQVVGVCTVNGVLRLVQTSHAAIPGLLEAMRDVLEHAVRTDVGDNPVVHATDTEFV